MPFSKSNVSKFSDDELDRDLVYAMKNIYDKSGLEYSRPNIEEESAEYAACDFKINKKSVKFRKAKTTPTKVGLFVTIWKRDNKGITQPYDLSDPVDLFVISVKNTSATLCFQNSALLSRVLFQLVKMRAKEAFVSTLRGL
jgi:hypothetical protein